ncbi:MAG TPA: flagellin [Caulobacteraceae bacterium]|jgi:flagellar hook-associated protein 3 FlgL|nr:flagellin [Caulobacteraceae bacterium]
MERISTATSYHSALLNILSGQNRQSAAESQVSTGKVASDLKGYGVNADSLTATRSLKARVDSHIANAKSLASTLDVQDQALGQLADAAQSARGAVAEAIATGSADGLMTALQGYLGQAVDSLNTEYQGRHLFGGGQSDTAPVGALTLADLTAAPSIASLFGNDQLQITNRLDDNLAVSTNFLASDLGGPLMTALKAVQALDSGPLGPLTGTLTQAQSTALTGMIAGFDGAWNGLNESVAENGGLQNRVSSIQSALTDRQTALSGVLGDMTDVDMSAAVSRLQLAQTAVQASAQVFATLQGSSLLNVLK